MAFRCDICNKKSIAGKQHKHHKGVAGGQWIRRAPRTLRLFRPNLQAVTLEVDGKMTHVRACTKCIKRVKFNKRKQQESAAATTTVPSPSST